MGKGTAFWREVIDYLPHLVFVFRIDENENAHLIFVNKTITSVLGYTAKEYVLQAETASQTAREVELLVEEIARRSHDVQYIEARPCTLTAKDNTQYQFDISFRLFTTSSQKSNLIAVSLQAVNEHPEKKAKISDANIYNRNNNEGARFSDESTGRLMVMKSELIRAVWKKARNQLQSVNHLLFVGEVGTGKQTLAQFLIEDFKRECEVQVLNTNSAGWEEQPATNNAVLFVPDIHCMDRGSQHKLAAWVEKYCESDQVFPKIIATSTKALEQLVEEGDFKTELYYRLSFSTMLVPPLRQRPEDVKMAAKRFIERARKALNLPPIEVNEKEYKKLMNYRWDENFNGLFEVLRKSILSVDRGRLTFSITPRPQSKLFEEQEIDRDDVLSFDEMNRRYLERILEITSGKIYGDDGAAALLDLKPTTLQSKLKKLGLR